MKLLKTFSIQKALPWILVIAGTIGLLCSFIITNEKINLLENPNYKVPCNIDPIISCGSVMSSGQANAFGFMNTIIGMAAFPVLITTGALMLSGAQIKRWFALGLNFGALFGVIFVHWLFYQSVWSIQALCPWCMIVWAVTITTFWYTTLYNLRQGFITLPAPLKKAGQFAQKHHLDILIGWLVIIAALILNHFWYFYGPKLGF